VEPRGKHGFSVFTERSARSRAIRQFPFRQSVDVENPTRDLGPCFCVSRCQREPFRFVNTHVKLNPPPRFLAVPIRTQQQIIPSQALEKNHRFQRCALGVADNNAALRPSKREETHACEKIKEKKSPTPMAGVRRQFLWKSVPSLATVPMAAVVRAAKRHYTCDFRLTVMGPRLGAAQVLRPLGDPARHAPTAPAQAAFLILRPISIQESLLCRRFSPRHQAVLYRFAPAFHLGKCRHRAMRGGLQFCTRNRGFCPILEMRVSFGAARCGAAIGGVYFAANSRRKNFPSASIDAVYSSSVIRYIPPRYGKT